MAHTTLFNIEYNDRVYGMNTFYLTQELSAKSENKYCNKRAVNIPRVQKLLEISKKIYISRNISTLEILCEQEKFHMIS